MMKNKTTKGKILMLIGIMLISYSIILLFYNMHEENRAAEDANQIYESLSEAIDNNNSPNDNSGSDGAIDIDGSEYAGIVSIPTLDIKLPVFREWSYPNLMEAPCRYLGSVNDNNMIIAAHNYRYHFGNINLLSVGDKVIFTTANNEKVTYIVSRVTTLGGTSVEEMQENSGDWDLTLFTCTYGGVNRVTVRCVREDRGFTP